MDHAEEMRKAGNPVPELVGRIIPAAGGKDMNTGFSYPGANTSATRSIVRAPSDPNAPRTSLNPETDAALASTFKEMGRVEGVYPKAYPKGKK